MAACNLKIQLDEAKKIRTGAETVTGTVVVRCDKDCNCKGLEVSTQWTTHGRGNIDRGIGEQTVVFEGSWQAGQEYCYPFKLKAAEWPPTYYGNYLNVSHSVEARAKLSWAKDPKASVEFPMVVTSSPADVQPSRKQMAGGCGVIGWLLLSLLGLAFAIAFVWLIPIILIIAGLVWFFKSFLPKQLTGSIKTSLEPKRVRAGETVRGHLSFTPKRSVNINAVNYKFAGFEKCMSGSGSNRQTHVHELFQQVVELTGTQRLPGGQVQSFDFEIKIPNVAAPSMKLMDNEVNWTVELRIDIPRWPDWSETFTLIVEPSAGAAEGTTRPHGDQTQPVEDEWFEQVLQQLQESDDEDRLRLVLEAIHEHEFTVSLEIDDVRETPTTNFLPTEPGEWLDAYDTRHEMDIVLFIPSRQTMPPLDSVWKGRVGIIDYNAENDVLIVKAIG